MEDPIQMYGLLGYPHDLGNPQMGGPHRAKP